MKGFIGFTKRNLLIYFKDKQAILFSLLTSIIVFVLYLLFLKGSFVDAIESAMQGLEDVVRGYLSGVTLRELMLKDTKAQSTDC